MSRYNLIEEPWIPVRDLAGNRKELGICDVLLTADNLSVIEDPSPLVTAALHRFLLAVLYRAIEGPCNFDEAKELFKKGLPKDKIQAYLEKWKDRFWLFHDKYPFGQNPNVPEDEVEPWTKLIAEYNATTVLFNHTDIKNPGERPPAECARWLTALMNFSVSGGRGYCPSPSPNAVVCIPIGKTLIETLLYLLVHQNQNVMKEDKPIWEKDPLMLPLTSAKRIAMGYADYYTWPARFVLLNQAVSGNIKFVRFVAGEGFERDGKLFDPMQGYRQNDKHGLLPIQFEEKGFWRDFYSILPDGGGLAPKCIENAIELTRQQKERVPKSVMVLGLRNEPPSAKLEFWRMERFVLPGAIAGDKYISGDIHSFLDEAEKTSDELNRACREMGRAILTHGDRDLEPDKWKGGKLVPGDLTKYVNSVGAIPHYWSILEASFHKVLHDYTLECNPGDIHHDWLVAVRNALREAWNLHEKSVSGGDAWALRALVKSGGIIGKKINELNDSIKKLEGAYEHAG